MNIIFDFLFITVIISLYWFSTSGRNFSFFTIFPLIIAGIVGYMVLSEVFSTPDLNGTQYAWDCVINGNNCPSTSNQQQQKPDITIFDCKCLDMVEKINKICDDKSYYIYNPSQRKATYDKCIQENDDGNYSNCLNKCQKEWKRRLEQVGK